MRTRYLVIIRLLQVLEISHGFGSPALIVGGVRDELPWKIKASVLYSARAHPGALRSLAVHDDECTVFTGGVGPGFKGSIQRWELPNMSCISGYYGHEEVSCLTVCLKCQ
jgi:hypothetical protein